MQKFNSSLNFDSKNSDIDMADYCFSHVERIRDVFKKSVSHPSNARNVHGTFRTTRQNRNFGEPKSLFRIRLTSPIAQKTQDGIVDYCFSHVEAIGNGFQKSEGRAPKSKNVSSTFRTTEENRIFGEPKSPIRIGLTSPIAQKTQDGIVDYCFSHVDPIGNGFQKK